MNYKVKSYKIVGKFRDEEVLCFTVSKYNDHSFLLFEYGNDMYISSKSQIKHSFRHENNVCSSVMLGFEKETPRSTKGISTLFNVSQFHSNNLKLINNYL